MYFGTIVVLTIVVLTYVCGHLQIMPYDVPCCPGPTVEANKIPKDNAKIALINYWTSVLVEQLDIFLMGVNFLSVSAVCTILSLVGVQYWTQFSLEKHQPDVLIVNDLINSENATRAIELLFSSYTTLLLVSSLAFNVIILVILGLKVSLFFGANLIFLGLHPSPLCVDILVFVMTTLSKFF